MLIVFGGLPGTGKTTLARAIAHGRAATYLRIDTIEQALRAAGASGGDVGPAGYAVAQALAEANLALGGIVVADAVNPVAASRDGWRAAARRAGAALVEIEVVCSDPREHRRRVEGRDGDIPGLAPPTWQAVASRHFAPWPAPHLVVDTAGRSVPDTLAALEQMIDGAGACAPMSPSAEGTSFAFPGKPA